MGRFRILSAVRIRRRIRIQDLDVFHDDPADRNGYGNNGRHNPLESRDNRRGALDAVVDYFRRTAHVPGRLSRSNIHISNQRYAYLCSDIFPADVHTGAHTDTRST